MNIPDSKNTQNRPILFLRSPLCKGLHWVTNAKQRRQYLCKFSLMF